MIMLEIQNDFIIQIQAFKLDLVTMQGRRNLYKVKRTSPPRNFLSVVSINSNPLIAYRLRAAW